MLPNQKKKPEKIRISTWQDMGKTFRGIGEAIFLLLAALVVTLLLIVSILIGNLVTLMGIERYREIGTLRAVGFGRRLVTRLFMGEIMGVTAVFAAAGAAAGAALVLLLGRAGLRPPVSALEFVMGKSLHPVLSLAWVAGLLAAVEAFAFAASFLPARRACALPPAEAMSDRQGGGE
jgi:putative ABC transport system permease protein